MSKLRTQLDKTVDLLVEQLEKKHFAQQMPKGLDKEHVAALQARFASVMKKKMCQEVEFQLREDDYATKLNKLDQIIKNTQQSVSHRAWRPPAVDTVENSMVAHDLAVSLEHKDKLAELLRGVEDECEELTNEIHQVERRFKDNQAVLNNMERSLENITNKINQNQQ